MRVRLVTFAFAVSAFSWGGVFTAWAAPATPEQAGTMQTAFERYFGKGGPAGPAVKVTPAGESYNVDFDFKQMLSFADKLGLIIDPITYRLVVSPQGGSLWHVTTDAPARFSGRFGDHTFNLAANGVRFDGVFDAAIPSFRSATSTYDSISIGAIGGKQTTQTRETTKVAQNSTSTPAGDGVVDAHSAQTSETFAEDITIDGGAGEPNTNINVVSGGTAEDLKIEGMKIRAVADLWTFFVSHASPETMKASESELRALLLNLLPVFGHLEQSGSVQKLLVKSPVGLIGADTVQARIELNGLVEDGKVGSTVKLDGLTIPDGIAPPWADGLIPIKVDLTESFAGFHLGEMSRQAIQMADTKAKEPFTPEQKIQLIQLLGPLDQMVLTIAPSELVSRLLDVKIQGTVRMQQPIPDLDVKIKATGVDKAVAEVQSKGRGQPELSNIMAVVALVKGYGRADPDGSLNWDITRGSEGDILINGVALPVGKNP